ncbi:hypothetical protein GQ43DRAFT_477101 [Delitschia confertaspora ATCC 74209]|uniref:TOG domain-containing protein n=1 Tax=Delitschia confertaspora ATCC 74209 TaxID=1513339 RepID=A0A9P4JV90_9PLEO|nr:hypothetical protein GQ43DRAFT_477101 [Delitschia confertaspora ATCC 74209]
MEEQAATLLVALKKPSAAVDTKLQLFNNLKSNIKHLRVPESSQAPIFECIKLAISANTSAALVSTGFSTLGHFIKRLVLQNQTAIITHQSHKLLAILLDRLGDARESHRNAASQLLSDIWPLCHAEVEALIRDSAMKGTNPRAKEMSMLWLVKMHKNEGLPFRSFVPLLMANLEDADPAVRETAKTAVVELFSNAPEHAKADLKKQLSSFNVRKTIAAYITSHLSGSAPMEGDMPPPERPLPVTRAATLQPDVGFADSMLSEQPPPPEVVPMDPIHVYTQRELDEIFRNMAPCFEGKETEGNWLARDKNTLKLRRITKGNAPTEFHGAFIAGIKSLLDGILKVANSLRTTMSSNGCQLIQELAKTLGPAMDPWVEILLQSFIKMCGATKNIAAQNGNTTVDIIVSNVSYNNRIMQHVSLASQDKNVQPRIFSAAWVKTLILKHKSAIEHSGGLDVLDKAMQKGLVDANPKVREAYRNTYWTFALVWPQKAEAVLNTLDPRNRKALDNDPNNPNASLASSQASASSFSKSVGPSGGAAARMALKEKIAEQRRARLAATKGVPERPNSAQAAYTPAKSQSSKSLGGRTTSTTSIASSTARPPSAMSGNSTKSALSTSGNGTGSLMAGTVRRPIRPRPELTRPATADPYASRRAGGKTPNMTPEKTPVRETVKKSAATKSTIRPRAQTQQSPNVSPIRNKTKADPILIHRKTPSISSRQSSPALSPSKNEDLTILAPFGKLQRTQEQAAIPFRARPGLQSAASVDSAMLDQGDEDGFTMVIPNLAHPLTQAAQSSPPKAAMSNRLEIGSPRSLRSPRSAAEISSDIRLGVTRSPRMRSPEHRAEAPEAVQVYEDPYIVGEPGVSSPNVVKPVLEELPLNKKSVERRQSNDSGINTIIGDGSTPRSRGHLKTTSTGSVIQTDNNEQPRAEVLKNRQLLTSGINKIRNRTVDAHMFRRLQDMIKSNQEIWGTDNEKFGELLLASLDYLQAPTESLKLPPMKAANLKVQVLATVRAMLALYRRETAKYFSRVLCAVLQTKAQYENTSHIASDLEATADEITRYGQTSDCLNAVLDLIESSLTPTPTPTTTTISSSSPSSSTSSDSLAVSTAPVRTTTMALATLANLLRMSSEKGTELTSEQTRRLGRCAVRFLDDVEADVRKADVGLCVALHEKIGGRGGENGEGKDGFWKAVAGAREQHLNLITYFLAKRGMA